MSSVALGPQHGRGLPIGSKKPPRKGRLKRGGYGRCGPGVMVLLDPEKGSAESLWGACALGAWTLGELGLKRGDTLVLVDEEAGLLLHKHGGHERVLGMDHDERDVHL